MRRIYLILTLCTLGLAGCSKKETCSCDQKDFEIKEKDLGLGQTFEQKCSTYNDQCAGSSTLIFCSSYYTNCRLQ